MDTFSWRPIPGLNGAYEAHFDGRIRNAKSGLVLKPSLSGPNRTPRTHVQLGGHQHAYLTMVLVGLTWLRRPLAGEFFALFNMGIPQDVGANNIRIYTRATYPGHYPLNVRQKMPPAQVQA
jgi:hypothetical protein